jgi:hypothetical protein
VEVCTPISETGRVGALPAAAANLIRTDFNKKQTPDRPRALVVCNFINILTKATVLVLNRNWQAINVRTPQEAFCMMATNVATGLEIEGEDHIRPVTWEEWITLPILDQDESVHTVRGQIRVPTVIVAVNSDGTTGARTKRLGSLVGQPESRIRSALRQTWPPSR